MEMRMKKVLVGVLALMTLTACSSKGSSTPEESGPIVGTWKVTAFEERIGETDWAPNTADPCVLDNTEEYEGDGSWTLYDGNNRCGTAGIRHGTWRLTASNTKVVYTYEGIRGEYESTVESLTETELVLTRATGEVNGRQTRHSYRKQ
jgi:hypothetical protein